MDNCQGACEDKGNVYITVNINIEELHVVHEDQCTYVDNVYMGDEDEGMEMDINLDLEE